MRINRQISLIAALGVSHLACAQQVAQISEKDFLEEMPIVLSVSRLPQRLDETPGAVTILDRQMIRQTGARDVADLLRFVPGFQVSNSFESNSPQGSYHLTLGDYSNRVQVMVDGRSVYSPFLWGSTGPGLQTVAIDDIERIEVLRGSNSAAYGARAFLGTINIVTRDTVDTLGVAASVAAGDNGIQDTLVRLGWGDDTARFRMTADRRADMGLSGSSGPDRVNRVNLRADLKASAIDQIELRVGQSVSVASVGFDVDPGGGNGVRDRSITTSYLQADWRRNLGADQDLALQFSHMEESVGDQVPYAFLPTVLIDWGGRATSDNVSLQHTLRSGTDFKLAWGAELRRETIVSRALYDTDAQLITDFYRLFGNGEWHLNRNWVFNAGGMYESNSVGDDGFFPRAMLNWHLAPGQTLRVGVSMAQRPPSTFENFGHVVLRDSVNPAITATLYQSRPGLASEKIASREIGYLGDFAALGLSLDVRIFDEVLSDLIKERADGAGIKYYINDSEVVNIHGVEYQLRWRPWSGANLSLGQIFVDNSQLNPSDPVYGHIIPRDVFSSTSLMFVQKLDYGMNFSLMYSQIDAMPQFPGADVPAPAMSRTDVRVAKQLSWGKKRGEVSFVVQNLGPAYQDFLPSFYFRQQAYVMLRLDN
jgi:iron complex outermembrane receptor protein